MTLNKIIEEIDLATEPERMTATEALRFLEQLSTEIECRIDGIRDDLRNAAAQR